MSYAVSIGSIFEKNETIVSYRNLAAKPNQEKQNSHMYKKSVVQEAVIKGMDK